jgi:hypothetical protein
MQIIVVDPCKLLNNLLELRLRIFVQFSDVLLFDLGDDKQCKRPTKDADLSLHVVMAS